MAPGRHWIFSCRYGLAVACALLATWLRFAIDPYLLERVPFVTFFPAVFITALYAGFGPALLAVLLSYLASAYYFVPPAGRFLPADAAGWTALGLFTVFGLVIALLCERVRRDAVRALRESEKFTVTLSSIGDAVVVTDTKGEVVFLNGVAERLTGWTLAEAVGKPLDKVFCIVNELTGETVESPASRALSEGVIVELSNHTVLIARDGSERPIDDSAAPIRSPTSEILGCVVVFHDVTKRREAVRALRQSEEQLRLISNALPALISYIDADERYAWVNAPLAAQFQRSVDAIVGQPVRTVVGEESYRTIQPHLEAALGGVEQKYDFDLCVPDSKEVRVKEATYIPHRTSDGEIVGCFVLVVDVTERRGAEEMRARLAAIIESSNDAIIGETLNGEVTSWNRAAEKLYGYALEEMIGKSVAKLAPPERGKEWGQIFQRLRRGEPVEQVETEGLCKDGSRRQVSLTISPIRDAQGKISGISTIARDISERKRTEQALSDSEERLRLAANAAHFGNYDADLATGDVYWSPEMKRIVGLPEDAPLPASAGDVPDFIHAEDRASFAEAIQTSLDPSGDGEFSSEHRICPTDGSLKWVLMRGRTTFVGVGKVRAPRRASGTIVDVTDRKRLEEELRQLAADLSRSNRHKDEFLATLAHELRNPLAPIRTGLELMKMVGDDPESLEQVRVTLERQTHQLITLVDDLMNISRITRGKLELHKRSVRLDDILQSAMEACQPFIDDADHELSVQFADAPMVVHADPNRLAQVFSNLINNAVKYSPEPGCIRLTAERRGNEAVVTVQDRGIGIPTDKLDRVFEMFAQVEQPLNKQYSGLGIGLTLVKSLVEMHGGSVEVQSPGVNEGSTFRVRIPIPAEAPFEEDPALKPVNASAVYNRQVLVVDDNRAAADMLRIILEKLGGKIRTAGDGREAIQLAESFRPDIVLMDLGMPTMNGYEAARHIRRQSWGKEMLLVALTGWGQDEDRRKTSEAGFDFHVVKPVELATLLELLNNARGA
ncbi:PAS domain S-box protein [Pirellulales bacterium]|nr:PAS domain S-box protein [Pirellulales bacterium]